MPGHTSFVPEGKHVMDVRVEVRPREVLNGRYFPTVFENGKPLPWDRKD